MNCNRCLSFARRDLPGSRRSLWGLSMASVALVGCATPSTSAAEIVLSADEVVVPMNHMTRHVAVEVEIDGRGPFLFQVDTYASIDACVDDDFAAEMGFRKIGTTLNSDGRTTQTKDLVEIEELKLGGATLTGLRTLVDDYDWVRSDGAKIHGLLGFAAFREVLLTFDYPGSRLVLRRGNLSAQGEHTIAFEVTSGSPDVRLPIGTEGDTLLFGIDTGASATFSMQLEDAERFPLFAELEKRGTGRTVYSEFDVFGGVLTVPIDLAGHTIEPVFATFTEGQARRLIGYGVLRSFAMTFDQGRRLVRFERPVAPAQVQLSEEALDRWVGTYESADTSFEIERGEGGLCFRQEGAPPLATLALAQHELQLAMMPVRLSLGADSQGRQLLLIQGHPEQPSLEAVRVD